MLPDAFSLFQKGHVDLIGKNKLYYTFKSNLLLGYISIVNLVEYYLAPTICGCRC